PVLVGTLLATWTGSGSLFNGGRLAYENGFAALWSSVGSWIGIVIVVFLAQKIRRGGKLSVPHILEDRYNQWVGLAATLITIVAYVTIVSYQFRGGGRVITLITGGGFSLFGLTPLATGMVVTAVFAVGYTMLAGMVSVTYTDVLNGIVMLVGIAIAIPFALDGVDGLAAFARNVPGEKWQIFGSMGSTKAFAYLLPTMFLLLGDANMYQRFLSAKNEREARRSAVGWIAGTILIELLIVSLAFIGTQLEGNLAGPQAANIIPLVALKHVPVVIGCLLLGAMVAIIVSTADSFLLVPATNISHDLYQRYFRPGASQKELLMVSRAAVLGLGILAFLMVSFFETILEAAYAAYTVYGAGITPALLGAFLWKRTSTRGAMMSILGGSVVTVGWEIAKKVTGAPPLGVDAIYPALVVSVALLVAGSTLRPGDASE
ncbi:MAG: sodium:solute symporter, partial [Fidelibacterota bacterium]